jgi:hypothetical protein
LIADELTEDDNYKERILKQIFFISNAQITYTKRFITDQMLLINKTFEINQLRMILLVIVGITFINKNFPAAYNFAKSETAVSFNFLFDNFRYFVFSNDIAEPQVILVDQTAGLIAVMPISMPNCLLQHYNWHIAQNIAKRLAEKRYLIEKCKEIMNYV